VPARPLADALNWSGVVLALCASGAVALDGMRSPRLEPSVQEPEGTFVGTLQPVSTGPDARALPDATRNLVPLLRYRRVASASLLADPLLLELAAPDQIVAFSSRASDARDAYRYAGKPHLDALHRAEDLLNLSPDLVLVNSLGDFAAVARLREAGLRVFDLGPMRGVQTFLSNVLAVGWLLGHEDAARDLALHFQLRLGAIASGLPSSARRGAIYLGVHGTRLYGGTRGSSYHDVLHFAGLEDVAARQFSGWPSYDPEQVLSLDPEIVVTQTGMRVQLCERREFARLRACGQRGQVIEIDGRLLNDAGFGMLDASELIHRAAYAGAPLP
jgi:iron complex transport system substrate-binding protein